MRKALAIFLLLVLCMGTVLLVAVGPAAGQATRPERPDVVTAATPNYYRVFQEGYLKSLPLTGGYYSCLKSKSPYTFFWQDWYGVKLAYLLDEEVGLREGTTGIRLYAKDKATVDLQMDSDVRPANSQGLYTILGWQKGVENAPSGGPLTVLDNTEGPLRLIIPQHPNVGPYPEGSFNWNLALKVVRAIEVQPLPAGVMPIDPATIPDNQIIVYGNIHPYSITNLSPSSGPASTEVTISGYGFGSIPGTSYVSFGNAQATDCIWGCQQIKCKVPAGLAPGEVQVSVTTSEGTSNSLPFTVTGSPALTVTSITPTQAVHLWPMNVTDLAGTGFQPGATARLEMSGAPTIDATDLVVVSDTKVTCTFNVLWAPLGQYDVVVKNPGPEGQEARLPSSVSVTNICGQGAGMMLGLGIALGIFSIAGMSVRGRRLRRKRK